MKPITVLISLISADNDHQQWQAASAKEVHDSNVEVEVVFANHDAINQTQPLVKSIQADPRAAILGIDGGGGIILYIEGPSTAGAVQIRTAGMISTTPPTATVKTGKGDWSQASGYKIVKSRLSLSTSPQLHIQPPERTLNTPTSGPRIEELSQKFPNVEEHIPDTGG